MDELLAIQVSLVKKFPQLAGKSRTPRTRRMFTDVAIEDLGAVFDYAVRDLRFSILCTITGLDQGDKLGVIYHLARETGTTLSLCTAVPKDNPILQTVTGRFPAAELYEREMADLLGMKVQGLPEGPRYPLPDDWPQGQYPLRKDWKAPASPADSQDPTAAQCPTPKAPASQADPAGQGEQNHA
jgi:membrane-bound hydrogenase subunit beta